MATDQTGNFDAISFPSIVEGLPLAISVIDLSGTLLYFNPYAAKVLDRKPDYLGHDIRQCHKNPASGDKIDRLLSDFTTGRRTEFSYRARRYGRLLDVTFTPLVSNGAVVGVIQAAVVVKPDRTSTPSNPESP